MAKSNANISSKATEHHLMIKLEPATYSWLENRAALHRRARLREAVEIIEAERAREARKLARGTLSARGGAR